MLTKLTRFFLLVLTVSLLSACGGASTSSFFQVQETDGVRTVTHRFGKTEVPLNPQRVLALGQEYMLADLLDAGVPVVASSANIVENIAGFDPQELASILIFPAHEPNLETLSSLKPDLIIGDKYFIEKIGYDKLSGIAPTISIDVEADWRRTYLETLSVFGKADKAKADLSAHDALVASAKSKIRANGRLISVGTVYPDQALAAWVDGPTAVPQLLLDLGFTLSPSAKQAQEFGPKNGRIFLSLERLDLFAADTLILLQSAQVEGESESLADVKANPLWAQVPAVKANRVFELDRLGYPGLRGQKALLERLLEVSLLK